MALAEIRAKHDVPGLVGLTLEGDRVAATGAAGVRRRGGTDAITIDDKMHLGSCTKAMTATLCALLVQEKKLAWDAKPAEAFAATAKPMDPGWKDATLAMLLQNRGGAPNDLARMGLWDMLWNAKGPPREARLLLVRGVLGKPPVAPPGTKFEYSNAGFSIAGAMGERAADTAWEDLLRKRLFEPLGMKSAGFGAPLSEEKAGQPRGHRADGTPVDPGPGDDNPDAVGPAGKVHASLPDWAKFVALHLRRGKGFDGALGKIDFAKLHTPPVVDGKPADYAMGWVVAERDWGGHVLWHTGSNTMWFASVWIAPEKDFAVLAAANQGGDGAVKACDEAVAALLQDRQSAGK
jgi:CubicO group peptidase (beta-lactamase class C family)